MNSKKRVGDYLLGGKIGEGSFAKVRVAMHCSVREKVSTTTVNNHLIYRFKNWSEKISHDWTATNSLDP